MPISKKDPEVFPLTCPVCGGGLREEGDRSAAIFVCHIGHSFSAPEVNEAQLRSLDRVLNFALRALNERVVLCERFARIAMLEELPERAKRWREFSDEVELKAEVLKRIIEFGWRSQDQI
jgi:two-component system chemotaxis response regulator CheB